MLGTGAPTSLCQNLTSGVFHNQNEILILSCKSCGETGFQAEIYAAIELTNVSIFNRLSKHDIEPCTILNIRQSLPLINPVIHRPVTIFSFLAVASRAKLLPDR